MLCIYNQRVKVLPGDCKQIEMPIKMRVTPIKNLKSTRLSPLSSFWATNAETNVTQFTDGTAIYSSFVATTKLFKIEAN